MAKKNDNDHNSHLFCMTDFSSPQDQLEEFLRLPENAFCADCNSENPSWVSVNNCVFICTQCSGIHRSLGVEYSFVQSVKLDEWNLETIYSIKQGGGTATINETILEFSVPSDIYKVI